MAAADTARLIAELSLQDKFSGPAKKVNSSLSGLEKSFSNIGKSAAKGVGTAVKNLEKLALGIGVAGGVALVGAVKSGISSLQELSQVTAQTNAVIASTAGVAGVTAAQVRSMAESLEDITTVDDKVIQSGENMLLTFTNIGAKVFPRATEAMTNMAIAMNGGSTEGLDLKSTAIQLGKALNDPVKGITALKRVGVTFTQQQFEQILAMEKVGDVAGAQGVILAELEKEFGNAGKAAGQDAGAPMRRLKDVMEDLSQTLARAVLPVLIRATDWLGKKLADPKVVAAVGKLGDKLAEIGTKGLAWLDKVDWSAVGRGLGEAKDAAQGIAKAFLDLPGETKALILAFAGLTKLTGGAPVKIAVDLVKGVFDQLFSRGSTPANPLFVKDITGGIGGAAGAGGVAAGAKGGIGLLGASLLGILGGELAALVLGFNEKVKAESATQTAAVVQTAVSWLASHPTTAQLQSGLAGTDAGIREINRDPVALFLNAGGIADTKRDLQTISGDIQRQLTSNYQQEHLLREMRGDLQRPQLAPEVNVKVTNNISTRDIVSGAVSTTTTSFGISSGSRSSRIAV